MKEFLLIVTKKAQQLTQHKSMVYILSCDLNKRMVGEVGMQDQSLAFVGLLAVDDQMVVVRTEADRRTVVHALVVHTLAGQDADQL